MEAKLQHILNRLDSMLTEAKALTLFALIGDALLVAILWRLW